MRRLSGSRGVRVLAVSSMLMGLKIHLLFLAITPQFSCRMAPHLASTRFRRTAVNYPGPLPCWFNIFSSSSVMFGATTDSLLYRVGQPVTLAGILSDSTLPIRTATMTAETSRLNGLEAER